MGRHTLAHPSPAAAVSRPAIPEICLSDEGMVWLHLLH